MAIDLFFGKVYTVPSIIEQASDRIVLKIDGLESKSMIQTYGKWKGLFWCLFGKAIRVTALEGNNKDRIFYLDRASSVEWINAKVPSTEKILPSSPISKIAELFNEIVKKRTAVFPKITKDLEEAIFSNLSSNALSKLSQVSKNALEAIKNSAVLKKKIEEFIEVHAVGPNQWKEWNIGDIQDKDINEANATLPWNIEEILSQTDIEDSTKKVSETHVLVWVPKKLIINDLWQSKYKNYYPAPINQLLTKAPVQKTGWVLMRKEILLKTQDMPYKKQQCLVSEFAKTSKLPYEFPDVFVVLACTLAHLLKTDDLLFSKTYTRCNPGLVEDCPITVGAF